MKSLDIGIDLDGVCYDFTASVRHYLVSHMGRDEKTLPGGGAHDSNTTWNFYRDCWGLSTDEFLEACNSGVDDGIVFLHGDPFPETRESLEALKSQGHRLHIITARSFGKRSHHNTSDWLERHEIPFDSLVFSQHKTIMRPDVVIDDHVDNQKAFMSVGVPCFLYTRPWNVGYDDYFDYRVNGWSDFLGVVQRMAVNG